MYPLASMQKLRLMREDRAQAAFVAAKEETRLAREELAKREEKTRRYEATKEERRDKVFAQVMGKTVSRDELDLTREAVTRIDEEGVLLRADEQKAAQEVTAKQRTEDEKHELYFASMKARVKIEEHRDLWEEAERKEEERKADLEMEEFTGKKELVA